MCGISQNQEFVCSRIGRGVMSAALFFCFMTNVGVFDVLQRATTLKHRGTNTRQRSDAKHTDTVLLGSASVLCLSLSFFVFSREMTKRRLWRNAD